MPASKDSEAVVQKLKDAEQAERNALKLRKQAQKMLESPFELDNEEAQAVLRAFKPPK